MSDLKATQSAPAKPAKSASKMGKSSLPAEPDRIMAATRCAERISVMREIVRERGKAQ